MAIVTDDYQQGRIIEALLSYTNSIADTIVNLEGKQTDLQKQIYSIGDILPDLDVAIIGLQKSAIGVQGQFKDVWGSIGDLWKSQQSQDAWITEINTRLSGQVTELGKTSGGDFWSNLGLGALVGGGGSLLLVGIVAFLILRKGG